MEDSAFNALQKLKYGGQLSNITKFKEAVNASSITTPFIQLVIWLTTQLKEYCKLEEIVLSDADTFAIDIKGFVRELGFPYGDILQTAGLDTAKGKIFILDFLITELQACRINNSNSSTNNTEIAEIATDEHMELDSNVIPKCIEKITRTLQIPNTYSIVNVLLFANIEMKIKELQSNLPIDYLNEPVLQKSLNEKQWAQVSKINDTMCQEYKIRRQMLIKRVDVTMQSFSWSHKLKKATEKVAEVFQPIRAKLHADSQTTIVDILAARKDLCAVEKTSSGEAREVTKCDINRVMIGKVPDRGGRPSLNAPPQEMPRFQQRKPDPPRGGGRGGGGRGGGRGGRIDNRDGGRGGGGWRGGRSRPYDGHRGGKSNSEPQMFYS